MSEKGLIFFFTIMRIPRLKRILNKGRDRDFKKERKTQNFRAYVKN